MPRSLPKDRSAAPNPNVAQDWTPLFEPFAASNGLVVEAVGSVEEMFALGDHFHNALETRNFSEMQARYAAEGKRHVYRVMEGNTPVSCGELVVDDGKVHISGNRADRNGKGSPESLAAVESLVASVNDGTVPVAHAVMEDGFETFGAPAPKP